MALKRDWLRKEPPAHKTGSDLFLELDEEIAAIC
jgi:hypothetical protein